MYSYDMATKKSGDRKSKEGSLKNFELFHLLSLTVILSSLAIAPFTFDAFVIPKILVLYAGLLAIAILSLVNRHRIVSNAAPIWLVAILIVILLLIVISTINSETPLLRSMFGQFGRGNGLLYYFAAFAVLIVATISYSRTNEARFSTIMTYLSTGLGVYALLQSVGIDFAKLDTKGLLPTVLTYGNSNFAGGMLAILFGFIFTRAFNKNKVDFRDLGISLLLAFSVHKTGAVQGDLIILFVAAVVIPIKIVSSKAKIWKFGLYFFWALGTVLVSLGANGVGPFAEVFKRSSFQMRIEYWVIGIRTIKDNLLLGVGPDRLYDITPVYMIPESLQVIKTTRIDSPHNWYIGFATSFGLIAAFLFVLLLTIILFSYLRKINLTQFLSDTSAPTFVAFLCVIIDALVSIEQPGLGIWLYLLAGKLLSATFSMSTSNASFIKSKMRINGHKVLTVGLAVSIIFLSSSLYLITERFVGDGQLRSAVQKSTIKGTTKKELLRIEALTIKLKSEPEYAVQSVPILAKYGAGASLLNVSESLYDYNPTSIQAIGIRAQVLKVVSSLDSSCPYQALLVANTPWDNKGGVVSDYLDCLLIGSRDRNSRSNLISIKKYLDYSFPAIPSTGNALDSILSQAVSARLEFELGNIDQAQSLKTNTKELLQDFQVSNSTTDTSKISALLNF